MTSKKKPFSKVEELKSSLEKRKQMDDKKYSAPKADEDASDISELSNQIKAVEEEAKTHYDKLLRVMAELDNYKKRSEREKNELVRYSNEQLVTDLLPVLDDLDRVLEHLPHGASEELKHFVSGVQMVAKQFKIALAKYGLKEIKTKKEKFNPEYHEAVAHISSDVPADYVANEHRKGYTLNDRVIRAAMVSVSKGSEE